MSTKVWLQENKWLPKFVFGALQPKKWCTRWICLFIVPKRRFRPFTKSLVLLLWVHPCAPQVWHNEELQYSHHKIHPGAELWGKYSCWCCLVKRIFHICNERVYHHRLYVTWHTVPRIQTRILSCKMWSIVFFFQKVCQNRKPDFVRSFAFLVVGWLFSKKK